MSVVSLVHRKAGISWPRDTLGVSLHFDCKYFRHSWQFSPNSPTGHLSQASIQFLLPSACILSIPGDLHESTLVSACFWLGITILVPFSISPSSMVISSLNVQNACILLGSSFMLLGHPFCILYLSMARVSSPCKASHNCCKLSLLALSWLII